MYEELVRVPLVISWPGKIRPARSDALVSLIDLLPTLCDLAGVPAPTAVDGLSLRPVLEQACFWRCATVSSASITGSSPGASRSAWYARRAGSTCDTSATAKSCTI